MYLLNTRKQKIQLARLDTEVQVDPVTRSLSIAVSTRRHRDSVNTAALVTRASRAFFEMGGQPGAGVPLPPNEGPPPVVFRESTTGLLHVAYREVVVRFRHGTPERKRRDILSTEGFQIRRTNPFVPDQAVVYDPRRKRAGEDLVTVANRWSEMPEVVFASPNFVSQFRRHVLPSISSAEWHLHNSGVGGAKRDEDVNVRAAWAKTSGDRKIVIAILDDGVDIDHPNLKPNMWTNPDPGARDQVGRDFFLPDGDPDQFNPRPKRFQFPFDQMQGNDIHGTCCAGIVAAAGLSGGSIGVAPGCRVLPVKVFHADDLASGERVANAIRYAAIHADILSCSWSSGVNPDIEQAIEDAGQLGRQGRGAAVFCAAGNGFHSRVGFPARDPNAIAVGASTDRATLADYSNVGPEIALVAPSSGGTQDIFTTDVSIPNRGFNIGREDHGGEDGLHTNRFGGTSAATPLAAGAAALVLSVHPGLSRTDLLEVLKKTADKIGSGYDAQGHSQEFGFGRVNVGRAVEEALAIAGSVP